MLAQHIKAAPIFRVDFTSPLTSKLSLTVILPLWFIREAAVIFHPLNSWAKWLITTTYLSFPLDQRTGDMVAEW